MMCFLKLFSDICLLMGGGSLLAAVPPAGVAVFFGAAALCALVFALSALLAEKGWLRFLPVGLLGALCFLPGMDTAGLILLLIAAAYTLFCIFRGTFRPEWEEQTRLFSYAWKIALCLSFFACLLNWEKALLLTLPLLAASLLSGILLNRSLRHEPAVRSSPGFQLINGLSLGVLVLGALLLGSPEVMAWLKKVLGFLYEKIIQPVLMAFVTLVMALLEGLKRLGALLGIGKPDIKPQPTTAPIGEPGTELLIEPGTRSVLELGVVRAILILLAAIIVCAVLWKLARTLRRRTKRQGEKADSRGYSLPAEEEEIKDKGPIRRIRETYRKYLKLYRDWGIRLEASDTSRSVEQKGSETFDQEAMKELREIYIRARYARQGESRDAEKARSLLKQIRKADQS